MCVKITSYRKGKKQSLDINPYVAEILHNLEKMHRRALRQINLNIDSEPWVPLTKPSSTGDEESDFDSEIEKH